MKIILVYAVCLLILSSCNGMEKQSNTDTALVAVPEKKTEPVFTSDSIKTKKTEPEKTEKLRNAHVWTYDTARDKGASVNTPSATVSSVKSLSLKSPNDGVNPGKLIIMNNHDVTNLIIAITKGEFSTDANGKSVRARFDGEEFKTYECTKSNNGDRTMLFVDNADKFIQKLKAAKRVTIEAEIEENGSQTMEFNVEGLNWK